MKVCFVAPFPPDMGGISDYSFNLTDALKGVRDFEFFVISRKVGTDENREIFFISFLGRKFKDRYFKFLKRLKLSLELLWRFSNH